MGWDAVNRFDQTSWVDFITPTDYPKPVRNRCVIEVFCGVFVLSLCFLEFSVGVRAFVIGLSHISSFLYARLQTGRIMVWWCLSVRPSVRLSIRPSVRLSVRVSVRSFSALFSYMLWHIELKFLHMTFFYCTSDQVRVSSLSVNFWRSYASLWTKNIGNVQFSTLFSYILWDIELKFCIWLCFNVHQIKFECRHFASNF